MDKKSSDNQSEQPQSAPTTSNAQPQSNGLAIAAMVVGIIAIFLGWVPFAGFTLGVTAIILAIIGLKKATGKGMSITGLITGSLAVLWNLIVIALFVTGLAILGGAVSTVGQTIGQSVSNYNKEEKAKIDAKKDFAKGTTATFDKFEVKANSVQRNYVPDDEFSQASDGNELIVVNVSVKNISSESASFSAYDLDINVNGIAESSSYITAAPEFEGGSMSKNATATGNIVYEVTKGASGLKLQYEEMAYDSTTSEFKTLTYTLEI